MRAFVFFTLLASIATPLAGAQLEEDGTRAAFIKQRPVAQTTRQRQPKPKPKPPVVANNGKHGGKNGGTTVAPKTPVIPVANTGPVGLGFSLLQIFDGAPSQRVDSTGLFRSGDNLRFVLESSIDGYLYVFLITHDTSGAKRPLMIYPDYRLDEGDNFVYAHTAIEIPSRRNPEFNIFKITGAAGTEELYFVVSREQLPNVPIGEELTRLCKGSPKSCPWGLTGNLWEPLERQASAEVRTSVRQGAGKRVSRNEETAIATRDLTLSSADEGPSVVAVNASADTPLLVRQVSIRHE